MTKTRIAYFRPFRDLSRLFPYINTPRGLQLGTGVRINTLIDRIHTPIADEFNHIIRFNRTFVR